jgi:hypothetical protein
MNKKKDFIHLQIYRLFLTRNIIEDEEVTIKAPESIIEDHINILLSRRAKQEDISL